MRMMRSCPRLRVLLPLAATAAGLLISSTLLPAAVGAGQVAPTKHADLNAIRGQIVTAGPIEFLVDQRVATGTRPGTVAAGRFNRDRWGDLVTANPEVDSITVLLQSAGGEFSRHDIGLAGGPVRVIAGDIDGDGLDDIAVTLPYLSAVALLVADGVGGFVVEGRYDVGGSPGTAVFADLDGDEDLDLACSNRDGRSISIFRNTRDEDGGTGSLLTPWSVHPAGFSPSTLLAGEFTGDGVMDLATADGASWTVWILPGLGSGQFGPGVSTGVGWPVASLAASDFDRDGDLDLASLGEGSLVVLRNVGNGAMTPDPRIETRWPEARSLVAVDFDADGDDDVAVSEFYGLSNSPTQNCVELFLNAGGELTGGFAIQVGGCPGGIIAGDLDDDRRPEIVTANYGSSWKHPGRGSSVSVLRNRGNGRLCGVATAYILPREYWQRLEVLERPGHSRQRSPDLLITGQQRTLLARNLGGGRFVEVEEVFQARVTSVADLDGDHITDVIVQPNSGPAQVHLGDRSGGFEFVSEVSISSDYVLADLDGDRLPDVLVRTDPVTVLDNLGHGRFGPPRPIGGALVPGVRGWGALGVADLDGDGRDELLNCGEGSGAFDTLVVLAHVPGTGFERIGAVAIETDAIEGDWLYPRTILAHADPVRGGTDIIVLQQAGGTNGTMLSLVHRDLDGRLELRDVKTGVGLENTELRFEDLDGDGRGEVITGAGNVDPVGFILIQRIGADGKLEREPEISISDGVSGMVLADLDADGDLDVATTNVREGGLIVLTNGDVRGRKPTSEHAASHAPPGGRSARSASVALASDGSTPTRIAFSMRAAGSARLELYDVGGRRVLSRDLGWLAAGEHSLELPELGALRAGIYWARVGARGAESVGKVVSLGPGGVR